MLGAISYAIPYQHHMTARGDFLYNFVYKAWENDLRRLEAISFTIPRQNHMTVRSHFLYNASPKSSNYDLWLLGPFPFQFLIKIIEVWSMNGKSNFLYNSILKSLKYDLWPLGTILIKNIERLPVTPRAMALTTAYQNCRNMIYEC